MIHCCIEQKSSHKTDERPPRTRENFFVSCVDIRSGVSKWAKQTWPSDRQQRYAAPQFSFPHYVDKYIQEQSLKFLVGQSPHQSHQDAIAALMFLKADYTLETRLSLVTDQKNWGLKKVEYKIKSWVLNK